MLQHSGGAQAQDLAAGARGSAAEILQRGLALVAGDRAELSSLREELEGAPPGA